jgi:hypothetical protein
MIIMMMKRRRRRMMHACMHACMHISKTWGHSLHRPNWWRQSVCETPVCNSTLKALVTGEYFNAFIRCKMFKSTVVLFFVVVLRHNTSRKFAFIYAPLTTTPAPLMSP